MSWRRHALRIVVCAAAALPATAQAGFKTGKDVLAFCTDPSPLKQSMCLSYLQGVADGLQAAAVGVGNLCMPRDVSGPQLIEQAVAILRRAPAADQDEAVVFVAPGFAKAWACRPPGAPERPR